MQNLPSSALLLYVLKNHDSIRPGYAAKHKTMLLLGPRFSCRCVSVV